MKMKALIKILPLIVILTVVLGSLGVMAASQPRLIDNAELLTSEEEAELIQKLDLISEKYGHDIAVVFEKTINGADIQTYTENYFDNNGYGMGETNSGVLLLVDMKSRTYWLLANGEAYGILGESGLDTLEEAVVSQLSIDDYYYAVDFLADEFEYIIKYDGRLEPFWIFIAAIFGVIVTVIVIKSMTSKHKNVKMQSSANRYMLRNTFRLDRSRDVYLYSHVTRVYRPKNNTSSGGSRSSGGGGSRGGRGGSF